MIKEARDGRGHEAVRQVPDQWSDERAGSMPTDLRADPRAVFQENDSALALHARRRWLAGAGRARSKARQCVREIAAAQQADGSWDGRTSVTIRRMFELWLLADKRGDAMHRGVDWLTQLGRPPMQHKHNYGLFFRIPNEGVPALHGMPDVPFTPGCSGIMKSGAAMFFACQLGRENQPHIARAFASAKKLPALPKNQGRWCSPSCGENLFQAFAVHPTLAGSDAVRRYVAYLADQQKPTGRFHSRTPFFPVVWGLSRLRFRAARRVFTRTLPAIVSAQRKDGAWGPRNRQLHAFIVLDSLERAGIEVDWLNAP